MGVTPKKVPATTLEPWHSLQPVLMPVWLKAELRKLDVSCTGKVKLLLLPTWQLTQDWEPMGMWSIGGVTIGLSVVVAAYSAALAALWHCSQLLLVDWMLAWMAELVGGVVAPNGLWQAAQPTPWR
jgi:hypothetical protein